MIGSTRQVVVYAYGAPVDLRRGFDGLSALVTNDLGLDLLAGDFYVFTSRTRRRAKVLLWDGTGLCIYAKRLERGRFACLWREPPTTAPLRLTMSELQLFLEGSTLVCGVSKRSTMLTCFVRSRSSSNERITASTIASSN